MEKSAFYGRWACQKMIESASSNLWDGHWACAVLSMARLLDERLLPAGLEPLVRRNLDQIVKEKGNQGIYDDEGEPKIGFRPELLRLLIRNGGKDNSLGHDAIYASYMLDLIERSGIPATQELFDAMATMLQGFADSGPGYVTINGIHTVVQPGEVPEAENQPELAPSSVLELFHAFSRPERMERGDMQLGHLLTHGHAVVELKRALRAEALEEHGPILDQSFSKEQPCWLMRMRSKRKRRNPLQTPWPARVIRWSRLIGKKPLRTAGTGITASTLTATSGSAAWPDSARRISGRSAGSCRRWHEGSRTG